MRTHISKAKVKRSGQLWIDDADRVIEAVAAMPSR
jgi:hypothetical protein